MVHTVLLGLLGVREILKLGFGVPYFDIFSLKEPL